jgi:WD40 repeat protein
VWDLKGNVVAELIGHQGNVRSASFSPDGERLVTVSSDKTAKVWDLKGNVVAELIGHQGNVFSASFSPDGQRLVTASDDKTAKVWDLKGNVIAELKGNQLIFISASFSPDGQRIVTTSSDKTAKVWWVDKNLEQLLTRGCAWLNDYLIFNPRDLEKLEVCQNSSNLKLAALSLVREGEEQARSGNIDTAIATFRKALKWNPQLNFNPEAKARQLAKASE